MNITFPVQYSLESISVPDNTLRNVYNAMAGNIIGRISDEDILPSMNAPQDAGHDKAPMFDGSSWKAHDGKAYVPIKLIVGNVTLRANPTYNWLQYLSNQNGTIALMDDVYVKRPTVILPSGTCNVDWLQGDNFLCSLTTPQTLFQMSNFQDGMTINILAVNSGTNHSLIWDTRIKFSGVPPAMPDSQAGAAYGLLTTIRNIGGELYAESQNQEMTAL